MRPDGERTRRGALWFGALLVSAYAHLWWWAPRLPATVPSHFDVHGRADGWMERGPFLATLAGTYALIALPFLVLPLLLPRLPATWINMPNREYWLAPERRAATSADMAARLLRFGAATLALMVVVAHDALAAAAAAAAEADLRGAWLALTLYAFYTVVWCVGLVRGYRLPRDAGV